MSFDIEAVAAFAQTFPDVTEGTRWGNRTWSVAGKAFVWERPLNKADVKRLGDARVPDEPIIAVRAEDLQTQVFEVGKRHPFESLRGWFQALYETLLGSSQGPRMGSFIALYGIDNSRRLIAEALDNVAA
jgi:hypothetical protein